MKNKKLQIYLFVFVVFISSCASNRKSLENKSAGSDPASKEIYNTIVSLDSIFWEAYNTCDMEIQTKLYSDSIEFFHDQAGLIKSKQIILDATKNNICGKIRRELVKGSIEVYPIPGFGAVEIGMHRFHNLAEIDRSNSLPGKFVFIWQHQNNTWLIRQVISLHD